MAQVEQSRAVARLQQKKHVQRYQLAQIEAKRKIIKEELAEWKQEGIAVQQITKEYEELDKEVLRNRENEKAEMRKCFHGKKG